MFNFFKRKKKPEEPAVVETVEEKSLPEEAAESEPESAAVAEQAALSNEVVEAVEAVVEPEPIAEVETPQSIEPETEHAVPEVVEELEPVEEKPQLHPLKAPAVQQEVVEEKTGWAARLKMGLTKSRDQMAKSLAGVFGGGQIDEDLYEELETVLLTSDMGIEATEFLMTDVRKRVSLKGLKDGSELRQALKDAIYDLLKPLEQPLEIPDNGEPFVIMMAGINGAGKTTSIGKLAKYFQSQGKSVMLAAGDTFRAAAREQLQEWGARNGVTVISQSTGDSAAVCFDAVSSAKAKNIDIVLADIGHAAAQCVGGRSLFGEALGGAAADHRRGPEIPVLEVDLAGHEAIGRLQRLDGDRQAVKQRIRAQLVAVEAQEASAGLDPGGVGDGDDGVAAIGCRDAKPVAIARGNDAFDLRPGGKARRFG